MLARFPRERFVVASITVCPTVTLAGRALLLIFVMKQFGSETLAGQLDQEPECGACVCVC